MLLFFILGIGLGVAIGWYAWGERAHAASHLVRMLRDVTDHQTEWTS